MSLAARRQIGSGGLARSNPPGGLVDQILAAYTNAGWIVPLLFVLDPSATESDGSDQPDLTFVSSAISSWTNQGSDTGNHATQGTVAARPTYSATAVNGKPGIYCDQTALLLTSAFDATAYPAGVVHCLYSRQAGAPATAYFPAAFGNPSLSSSRSLGFVGNSGGTNVVQGLLRDTAASSAYTNNSYILTTPASMAVTGDMSLASPNETTIRANGADVTSVTSGGNNTSTLGNNTFGIGSRIDGAFGHLGWISAAIFACGASPVPSAADTVGALLATEWGLI